MKAAHGPADGRTPADAPNGTGAASASASARRALNAAEHGGDTAPAHDQAIHRPAFATAGKYAGESGREGTHAGVASGA